MKKYILIIPAVLFLLCGCNKNLTLTESSEEQIVMNVFTGIASKSVPVTGTVFPTSRDIIISTYYNTPYGDGTSKNYFTGITFTKKSGSNTLWECGKYWPLAGTLDFLGYSLDNNSRVSSVSWGSNVAASVTMTLSDNSANQDDLLVGGASALTKTTCAVVFKHAEALLTCQAKCSVGYNSSTNFGITITDIKFNSIKNSGTVTCTRSGSNMSFAWSSQGSAANVSLPSMSSTNLTTSMAAINGTPGLMVPGQTQVGFTIYYTMHNGKTGGGANIDVPMTYIYTPGSPITWEAGKKYTYNIDMTLTAIEVSATVTDWSVQAETSVPITSPS